MPLAGMAEQLLISLIRIVCGVHVKGCYFCSVSFHAHIWLVIDFRDVSPPVWEDVEETK